MLISQQKHRESMTPQEAWIQAIQILAPKNYRETLETDALMTALGVTHGPHYRALLQFAVQHEVLRIDQRDILAPHTYSVGKAWIALQDKFVRAQ